MIQGINFNQFYSRCKQPFNNIDLKAGTTNEYGLLVVYHPVPEISTGCESLEVADKASVRKALINGQVFIIREGAVYTIFGQKAK